MKFLIIFIFSILSFLSFTIDEATIGVPAQLLIHPQSNALIIEYCTDSSNWEPVASTITFDHGTVVAGEIISIQNINKNFRIRRTNNSLLNGTTAIINLDSNKDDNFVSTDISHNFILSSEAYSPTKNSIEFVITSSIKTPVIPSSTPNGTYQKITRVIATVTP